MNHEAVLLEPTDSNPIITTETAAPEPRLVTNRDFLEAMQADPMRNGYLNNVADQVNETIFEAYLPAHNTVHPDFALLLHFGVKKLYMTFTQAGDYQNVPSGTAVGRLLKTLVSASSQQTDSILHLPEQLHRYVHAANTVYLPQLSTTPGWDTKSNDEKFIAVYDASLNDLPPRSIPVQRHRRRH